MSHIKNYWFPYLLAAVCYITFSVTGKYSSQIASKKCQVESDRPNCYIMYGIAQNDITKNNHKLKVNYLIEGFPKKDHDMVIEVIDNKGELDFLYSDQHTAAHKAHHCEGQCQRQYKAAYKIPSSLMAGMYKLRVTFKFKYALGTKDMVSNDIKFEVK